MKVTSLRDNIRPEDELLLLSVQKSDDAEKGNAMKRLIKGGVDWSYLMESSLRHGLMPHLYTKISILCPEDVPGDILKRFEISFRGNVLRNLALTRELFHVMDLFAQNGISAIPYRGPTLSILAHGDLSLRQFDDLDILVREEDVLKVREILIFHGFRPEFELGKDEERAYIGSNCEYNFYSERGIQVEIHWGLLPNYFSFPLDLNRAWNRLQAVTLSGRNVLTFSFEDLFLILCAHYGLKHRWERLGWILDLAGLIDSREKISWEEILSESRQMGIERVILLSLFLARDLFGTKPPEEVCAKTEKRPVIRELAGKAYRKLFYEVGDPAGIFKDQLLYLKMRERFGDKIRFIYHLVFTPNVKDWRLLPFGHPWSSVYYLLRPFRLIITYGLKLLRCIPRFKQTDKSHTPSTHPVNSRLY